jgi:hypothetical protein
MRINITKTGILQIEGARIIYRNFSGAMTKFNREGDRNFSVVIPNQEDAQLLIDNGWNVKIKDPREGYEDEGPFMHLPVKVKFNSRGPGIYVRSFDNVVRLNEETVDMVDELDIASVDMDIRPFNWEVNGKTGRAAYLQSMEIVQNIDRFGARYAEEGIEIHGDK